MATGTITKCVGLVTQYNSLGVVEGALTKADEVVVRRENVVETRRGHKQYIGVAAEPLQTMTFGRSVLAHLDDDTIVYSQESPFTGDATLGSNVISNISPEDIANIRVGSLIYSPDAFYQPGVPEGSVFPAVVTAVGVSSVTVDMEALGSVVAGTMAVQSMLPFPGTYEAPSDRKMRYQEANENLYVTTSDGVQVFGSASAQAARLAGMPPCLNMELTIVNATGNWLPTTNSVGYRSCYVRTDDHNNVIRGAPSSFLVVTNGEASDRCVTVRVYLDSTITTSDTIEVYRSANGVGTPLDDMNLLYQVSPTSTDITNKYIEFTDSTAYSVISSAAILYTSISQGGILQANYEPPLCKDLALYKSNYMFYANTESKQTLNMTFLGTANLGQKVSTGAWPNASDTITFASVPSQIEVGWVLRLQSASSFGVGFTVIAVTATTIQLSATNTTGGTINADFSFFTHRTVTLAGTTYSFSNTENTATGTVGVDITSSSAASQVENTSNSLVKVINLYASNTLVYAYYVSGPDDLPGQIVIRNRSLGGDSFTFQGSATSVTRAFYPNPPVSPSITVASTSSSDAKTNYVYYSQYGQLEGVPSLNFLPIGPSNAVIVRIFALRDSVIVVTDKGIYRVIGETAPFSVSAIDLTVYGVAPESWVTLSNVAIGLSNQGVVGVSDTNVAVVSHEIEPNILPLLTIPGLSTYSVGVSYESDRTYMLSTVQTSLDTSATQTYVYNAFTKAWTRWVGLIMTSGAVLPFEDKLYLSKPGVDALFLERKDFDDSDYADPEYDIDIDAISGSNVTITVNGSEVPLIGDVISQNNTQISIASITQSGSQYVCTMEIQPPDVWVVGNADVFPSIQMDVAFNAWLGGAPSLLKRMTEITVLTDTIGTFNTATSVIVNFTTDLNDDEQERTIEAEQYAWGSAPWGDFPWGGRAGSQSYNTYVPKKMVYARAWYIEVRHAVANERLSIVGLGMEFDVISERVNR